MATVSLMPTLFVSPRVADDARGALGDARLPGRLSGRRAPAASRCFTSQNPRCPFIPKPPLVDHSAATESHRGAKITGFSEVSRCSE